MTPTIRLGRLFGIEVGFNWSLAFIFALIAWSLASSILPQAVPGQPLPAYWATAVVGSILFYGCLLAHELSHAIMAQRRGVKVAGITLWLFGGVSQLESEPESAGSDALITAVGPLTSFVVAGIAFVLDRVAAGAGAPALVSALLGWLAILNLALGLFNLVPAFPLDGGRLLSAFFWWRSGSRQSGIHHAVRVGRIFAYLMIGLGLVQLFLGSILGGIWLAFVGWFLLSAAGAEDARVTARALLKSVPVSAAMTSPVVAVPDWLTVEQFLASVAPRHPFTTYPLHGPEGNLTGLIRLGDLLRVASPDRDQKRLRDFARPISEVPTAQAGEDLEAMLRRVGPALEHRVLVFDGENLVGILSAADVARLIASRQAQGDRIRPGG